MVLSLAYLLTELDDKVNCHIAQIDTLDNKADGLGKQAALIENKLEEDIDLFIGELVRRKEILKETLWQIVAREDKQLAKKKAEIMEHVNMLKCLEDKTYEDSAQFRELYGNAAERSDELDVGGDDLVALKLSCDSQEMVKAIKGFGTISYDVYEKGGLELLSSRHPNHCSKGQPQCIDVDFDATGTEVKCHVCPEYACDLLSLDLSTCCDVGEESCKTNTEEQIQAKDATWQQWLLQPRETSSMEENPLTLDSKLVGQLESLQLSQLEEAVELNKQEAFTLQFHEDLQHWLISKQRNLGQSPKDGYESEDKSAISQVWNEIKGRELFSWLKTKVGQEFSSEEKSKVHDSTMQFGSLPLAKYSIWLKDSPLSVATELEQSSKNVAQYEKIKSSALNDWLKMPLSVKNEDMTDSYLRMDSAKERSINYGVWLKRKHTESTEELETPSTKVFKRIRNTPLGIWLKNPQSCGRRGELGARYLKNESNSVKKADLITSIPLEMWLKCMKISENVVPKKYANWLIPRTMAQKGNPCHTSQSKVLQQFDEIAKSSLDGWMKNGEKIRKPTTPDFHKWLKNSSEEGSTRGHLTSGANSCYLMEKLCKN